MFKAAWKSLLGRKVRLLMSTFAIVLGVAFVAGTLIFTDTLNRSFQEIFASTVGDVVVRPVGAVGEDGTPTAKTMPAALVDEVAQVEGAARADGNVTSFGTFVVGDDGKVVGGQGAPGIGVSYNDAPAARGIEGLSILEGEIPAGPDEVAIDASTAETAGYEVGDRVHLVTSGEQAVLRPVMVGTAGYADGGSLNGATLVVFDTATAQDLYVGGRDVYNDAWVTAADGVSQEELRDQVAAVLPEGVEAVTGDQAADEAASVLVEAISFITQFLLVFAGVALVVGSFLIVNTFSILVAQRSRELALLRALGASRRQVTRSVLFESVVLGFVGSSVGLGLGVLLAIGIRALFASFGLDLSGQGLVFAPRTVIAAYAVGMVVTVAAAYLPARRASRIAPVSALRDDVALPEESARRRFAIGAAMIVAGGAAMALGLVADVPEPAWWVGAGILVSLLGVAAASPILARPFLALTGAVLRRVFGTVGTLAGQNSRRNPRRTTATASALMIGLALVTTMSILGASAKASVDKTIEDNFLGDLVVSNLVGTPFSTQVADDIEQTAGVESVTRMRYAIGSTDGQRQGLMGVDPDHLDDVVRLEMVEGSTGDLRDGTLMISDQLAEERDLGVGDTVAYTMPNGEKEYDVVGVFEQNPVTGFPYVTTLPTLVEAGFPEADNYLLVTREPAASQAVVFEAVRDVTAELPTVTVKDQEGYAEEQRGPIDQLLTLIYGLLGLALVIAILGIVNTLALSVIERTREVGLLRAIGLSRRQLRRMIGLESVVIALLGTVLGLTMGLVYGLALMTTFREEGLEVLSVPGGQLGWFVVAAVVVGIVAALLPARRAARLDVLRAIATE